MVVVVVLTAGMIICHVMCYLDLAVSGLKVNVKYSLSNIVKLRKVTSIETLLFALR